MDETRAEAAPMGVRISFRHDALLTALRAGADYLVTNVRHLLALHPYESVQIISMTEYRQFLEEQGLFV